MKQRLTFKLERRVRLPGQDWSQYRLEAECRHYTDIKLMCERRKSEDRREVDTTGRQVQAEYRVSGYNGEITSFIVGV